jgi:ABC-type amino acid transport substrate-binding protein
MAAFRAVNIPVTLEITSWSDGNAAVRAGHYDATFPYFATRFRRSAMAFSEPLINVDQSLFQRPPGSITFRSVTDLVGHTLCHPGGYALPVAVQRLVDENRVRLSLAPTPLDCLQRVATGAIAGVILPRLQVLTQLQAQPLDMVESDEPVERRALHVAGTLANPRGAQALEAFAAGRAALERASQWDRILARHLGLAALNWNRLRLADPEED